MLQVTAQFNYALWCLHTNYVKAKYLTGMRLIKQWDSDTIQQFQQIATYMMHETYSTGFHMKGLAGPS